MLADVVLEVLDIAGRQVVEPGDAVGDQGAVAEDAGEGLERGRRSDREIQDWLAAIVSAK